MSIKAIFYLTQSGSIRFKKMFTQIFGTAMGNKCASLYASLTIGNLHVVHPASTGKNPLPGN